MNSSDSDIELMRQINAALHAGEAEDPVHEQAYVAERILLANRNVQDILAELATGLSPYHVFGDFPIPGLDCALEVARTVMPPGVDTPKTIEAIRRICASSRPSTVADLGCGTGVLGISALLSDSRMHGFLIDLDPSAAACAERNVNRLELAKRASVLHADGLSAIAEAQIDLLIANLPFVSDEQFTELPARFRVYAPSAALRGGRDGLDILRELAVEMARVTRPGAQLILQLGSGQKPLAASILTDHWTVSGESLSDQSNILVAHR